MDRQARWFYKIMVFCLYGSLSSVVFSATSSIAFKNDVIYYIRSVATHYVQHEDITRAPPLDQRWNSQYGFTDWSITLKLYKDGKCISKESQHGKSLTKVLQTATETLLQHLPHINPQQLQQSRFLVFFHYPPDNVYAFLEDKGEGKEINGDRVVLRELTTTQLKKQIGASRAFLLHNMHPTYFGFYKQLNPNVVRSNTWLRTIYTASTLLTLMKMSQDLKLTVSQQVRDNIANFLLSMQIHQGPERGAFYYAFDTKKQRPIHRVVVGTASKTIFTLLTLYQTTAQERYLLAAKEAGDWLVKRVRADGSVVVESVMKNGQWYNVNKQSWLYSGQVLSALARLYKQTHNPSYRLAAQRLAQHMIQLSAKQTGLVGDDYRAANTISTSWLVYALMDYHRIVAHQDNITVIESKLPAILAAQIRDEKDAYNDGRFLDTMTSSGNGWLNEVLTEYYPFCQSYTLKSCTSVLETTKHTTRWLMQNTLTKTNSFDILYPKVALGGFIRNYLNKTIRTDSVCHGINSFINLIKIINADPKTPLVQLKERKFAEILGLMRIGSIKTG